jgi:hypothetical protein
MNDTVTNTLIRRRCNWGAFWCLLHVLLFLVVTQDEVAFVSAQPSEWLQKAQENNCGDKIVAAMMYISNESGSRFDVFWVNPKSQILTQINQEPVAPRVVAPYNSHVDQYMELHEVHDEVTGECPSPDKVCRRAYVKVHGPDKIQSKSASPLQMRTPHNRHDT